MTKRKARPRRSSRKIVEDEDDDDDEGGLSSDNVSISHVSITERGSLSKAPAYPSDDDNDDEEEESDQDDDPKVARRSTGRNAPAKKPKVSKSVSKKKTPTIQQVFDMMIDLSIKLKSRITSLWNDIIPKDLDTKTQVSRATCCLTGIALRTMGIPKESLKEYDDSMESLRYYRDGKTAIEAFVASGDITTFPLDRHNTLLENLELTGDDDETIVESRLKRPPKVQLNTKALFQSLVPRLSTRYLTFVGSDCNQIKQENLQFVPRMVMATSTFRSPIVIDHISGGLTNADNLTKMAAVRCLSALAMRSLHDFMRPYWDGFCSTLFELLDDQTTPHLLVKEIQHTMTLIHSIISPSDMDRYHLASLAWIEYEDVAEESAKYMYYQLIRPDTETLRAASRATLDTCLEVAPIGMDGMLSVHAAARVLARMQYETMGKLTEKTATLYDIDTHARVIKHGNIPGVDAERSGTRQTLFDIRIVALQHGMRMIPQSSPERSLQYFENVATVMKEVLQAPTMDKRRLGCLVASIDDLAVHNNNMHTQGMCVLLDRLQGILCDVADASKSSLLLVMLSHLAADPRVFSGRKEVIRGYERLWLRDVMSNKLHGSTTSPDKLAGSPNAESDIGIPTTCKDSSSPELYLTPGTLQAIKVFSIWYSRVYPTGALSVDDLSELVEATLEISVRAQSATQEDICIDALKCSQWSLKALSYLAFTTSTKPLQLIGPIVARVLDTAQRLSFGENTGTWDIRISALCQLEELATEFIEPPKREDLCRIMKIFLDRYTDRTLGIQTAIQVIPHHQRLDPQYDRMVERLVRIVADRSTQPHDIFIPALEKSGISSLESAACLARLICRIGSVTIEDLIKRLFMAGIAKLGMTDQHPQENGLLFSIASRLLESLAPDSKIVNTMLDAMARTLEKLGKSPIPDEYVHLMDLLKNMSTSSSAESSNAKTSPTDS
ncbi:hypothetical protein KI688_004382 [Linnemannia hyalina]|uniref:Uncharacterized protein n=1 Tax=Linnemannia hyalina TaxID=64524 RepID=A0A9P7XN07_9FUNG|nr:hypothetical protein KI688_004382 [Linnemannia hyalina]